MASTVIALLAGGMVYTASKWFNARTPAQAVRAIPSPRSTLLPHLSEAQASALPYPPNLLPGARDVDTFYGSLRVYEWGPENGRKVLMIPGDTSPAPVFGRIAEALVEKSFHVMIVDTWGRGYSDTPLNVPHNVNLFALQIFFAIASSPLPWTGLSSSGFSLIGFSLGGSTAMSFASHFPYLINDTILLAPGGLIKTLPEGYTSALFRNSSYVPTRILRNLLAKVLGTSLTRTPLPSENAKPVTTDTLDLPALWQWQFDYHEGFMHSFIDTTQHGPLTHQHTDWRRACSYIDSRTQLPQNFPVPCRLSGSKLLIICGKDDTVVVSKDVREAVSGMLGDDRLVFREVEGTHSFPALNSGAVIKHFFEFWGIED
ncbi:MAG: hypothetical protein Q9227_001630 [Pyrenula ochraceoflavens]